MCICDNYAWKLDFQVCISNPKNPKNPISQEECGEANPRNPKNPISEKECRACDWGLPQNSEAFLIASPQISKGFPLDFRSSSKCFALES